MIRSDGGCTTFLDMTVVIYDGFWGGWMKFAVANTPNVQIEAMTVVQLLAENGIWRCTGVQRVRQYTVASILHSII